MSCIKTFKKNYDAQISELATEILSKWRKVCEATSVKSEPVNPHMKKSVSQVSTSKRADDESLSQPSSPDTKPGSPKKQKLSLNAYKAKNNIPENASSSSSTSLNIKEEKHQQQSMREVKKEPANLLVPKPTVPLSNIMSVKDQVNRPSYNRPTTTTITTSYTNVSEQPRANPLIVQNAALENIMKNKNIKHVIYTGRKNAGAGNQHVSKLYDLAVRALVESLDELPNRISIYS